MFLFNDILVYGSILIRNKKYSRQHIIPLENVKIEDLADDDGTAHSFGYWMIIINNNDCYDSHSESIWLAYSNAHQIVCSLRSFS